MIEQELAINGGKPLRSKKIYYGHQYIDEADINAVVETLKSDYLTCGPQIEKLEKKLCEITGAKYAVAVSNGTAALHVACLAAGIGAQDEVITTPLTFAASSNCVLYCGGIPVFADVKQDTYNIDPSCVEACITDNTKAVIAVDFTGQAVQYDQIKEICRKHNLLLIEDAAHSIGTSYRGQRVGSIADMTTFSFHPVKTVTGGEGGAVLTDNKALYEKLLLFRSHGITRNRQLMQDEYHGNWYYEMVNLGYNYRMSDIQAALVASQLDKIEWFKLRRKEICEKYNVAFTELKEVIVQNEIPESDTARHLYILRLNLEKLSVGRKQIFDALSAENVECNVHYIPVYYFPYYQKLGYQKGNCPIAERIYDSIITLPLYPAMTDEDVNSVICAVKKVVRYYSRCEDLSDE